MSDAEFDPLPGARRLAGYWHGFGQLKQLPEAERPADLASAYRMQQALMRQLGEPMGGYKLGLSSAAAMVKSGLGEPILGAVPRSRLLPSGATIDLPPSGGYLIEVEVGFVLPGDFDGECTTALAPHLLFEIIRSRFARRNEVALPSFVADASGFHALVVGDAIPLAELDALLRGGATLRQNGALVAEALAGDERPDPFTVLDGFGALAGRYGWQVSPGDVVATGSITVPIETDAAGEIAGELGPYRVHATLRQGS